MVPVCPPTPTPSPGVTEAPYRVTPQVPVIPPGIVEGGNITGKVDCMEFWVSVIMMMMMGMMWRMTVEEITSMMS